MTLSELTHQVSALGYDGRRLPDAAFIAAVNRSLGYIYAESKVTGEYSFLAVGELPALRVPVLKHRGSKREALPLAGRVYSFYISGEGSFTLSGEDGFSYTEHFNSTGGRFCGVLPERNPVITFFGELDFTVFDLVCYSELHGDSPELIPDGSPTMRLDMKRAVADFVAFSDYPSDELGSPIKGVCISDSCVIYPSDFTGRINIRYFRSPKPIFDAEPTAEIDIPEDIVPFLPLLVSSYLYYDSDPELAEQYLEQYKSFAGRRSVGIRSGCKGEYKDTNGWA